MARIAIYTSLLTLFLITKLKAQQGLGCVHTTCPIAGQVRIDVIVDSYGNYAGGCNCACDPSIPCQPPSILNFDAASGLGDCSCESPHSPITPITTKTTPITPVTPAKPAQVDEVLCDTDRGTCSCPPGHIGACRIRCEGPDACKDAIIECNNDGYPCFVDCISENACGGSSSIMGPVNGALSVNCVGEKACEGHTQIDGEAGTDLSVTCDGATSCKDVQVNFGNGVGAVACNGVEACDGAVFNLLRNVASVPGAEFSCVGEYCPVSAPKAFSNAVVTPIIPNPQTPGIPNLPTERPTDAPTTPAPTARLTNVPAVCTQPGACSCQNVEPGACKITCDGATDACKDGVIECNSDGFDCVVDCLSPESCSGRSTITGPIGASLTVNCIGAQSCTGSTIVEGWAGSDLRINCAGSGACKGSDVVFIFGMGGINTVSCSGSPDSCKDAVFILPAHASSTVGMAFSCVGANCPAEHDSFNNAGSPVVVNTDPPVIVQPPTKQPTNAMVGSQYCCRTSMPNFKPLRGRCWGETTAAGCATEPNGRCKWDATNCLPDPPVNTYPSMANTACRFTYSACTDNSQCCSETCHAGNICS